MSNIHDEAQNSYNEEQRIAYNKQNTREDDETPAPIPHKAKVPTPAMIPPPIKQKTKADMVESTYYRRRRRAERDGLLFDAINGEVYAPPIMLHGKMMTHCHMGNVNVMRSVIELTDKHGKKFRMREDAILQLIQQHEFIAEFSCKYYYITPKL
jgi:hypothetical protein